MASSKAGPRGNKGKVKQAVLMSTYPSVACNSLVFLEKMAKLRGSLGCLGACPDRCQVKTGKVECLAVRAAKVAKAGCPACQGVQGKAAAPAAYSLAATVGVAALLPGAALVKMAAKVAHRPVHKQAKALALAPLVATILLVVSAAPAMAA